VVLLLVSLTSATPSRAVIVQPCSGPRPMDDRIGLVVIEGQAIHPILGENCLPVSDTISSATIDWGDGATSPGSVTYHVNSGGQDKQAWIDGTHTYLRARCPRPAPCPSAYTITATAIDDQTGARYTLTNLAPVTPGPSIASNVTIHAVRGKAFRGVVAHLQTVGVRFTHELSARVRWGDGTRSSAEVIGSEHSFDVIGTHRWRRLGAKPVTVTITDSFARSHLTVASAAHVTRR
jgi:hypothetical protein